MRNQRSETRVQDRCMRGTWCVATGTPNGGGKTIDYGTHKDEIAFAISVQQSHPDDQLWDTVEPGALVTLEMGIDFVEAAIAVVESADACVVNLETRR